MGKRVVHVAATLGVFMAYQREVERNFLQEDRHSFVARCRERASEREEGPVYGWSAALRIGRAIRLWGKR